MKKITLFAGVIVMGLALMSMADLDSVMSWDTKTHDFGKIEQNKIAEHRFTFVNEGSKPLLISKVKASCGCTVAEYTKEPIPPGAIGEVKARYDAKKIGAFNKTVTVTANTNDETVLLTLRGEVVGKEQ